MKPAMNREYQGAGRRRTAFAFAPTAIIFLTLLHSPVLLAQQPAASSIAPAVAPLTITSPAAMTVVHPGETISIEVALAPGAAFRFVTVVGEKSFGVSSPLSQAPYNFSFSVREHLSSGPHYFTAVGSTASGEMAASLPLAVDVENNSAPVSLRIDPPDIDLEGLGEELPIRVLGEFAGGVETDVTRSTLLHFASSSPSVATVSSQGIVRAVATGTAEITSIYQANAGAMSRKISTTVHEFAVRLSANSLEFGNQPTGTESAARTLTLTNPGQSPLQIREVRASGDFHANGNCVSAGTLPPGGSCEIAVTFEPSAAGPRSGSLMIATGAVSAASVILLSGTGVAR